MARKIDVRAKDYDERIYRKGHPPHRVRVALVAIVLLAIGTYLAWTKELPFTPEYEVNAVFENAANIRAKSPVRIAGVNVGEVKSIESVGDHAEVTFTVDDAGRPIREDAEVEIRPRIFLEGNFFLDVRPGSPSAPELPDGGTIPITHTATAVQLDQILTALQAPTRKNLQETLEGFGTGLNHIPTAAEDADQDPDSQGETGAESINDSFIYGGKAGRTSAQVNEALLGTEPHDLSGMIGAQREVFAELLSREQQLKDLITNFNITAGALAAESTNLSETVRLLAPTLEEAEPSLRHLNDALPALRAWAREITPGLEQLPATIDASGPWLNQTRRLMANNELGGIARKLRQAAPDLAKLADGTKRWLPQLRDFAQCSTETLIPTGGVIVDNAGGAYPFSAGVSNFKEFLYATVGFSGESQSFDGNGAFLRFQSGGGPQFARFPNPEGTGGPFPSNEMWTTTIAPPQGTRPVRGSTPPFRTDVKCAASGVPNVNGPAAAVGAPSPVADTP